MPSSRSQVVSPQVLDPEWKAIPLEKFSSAMSPLRAASHHWVHDIRKDDLFLVFRCVRLPRCGDMFETQLVMTISAGVEILERQDVGKLVTVAGEFDNLVRQGRVDRAVEAPIHVVIKLPCIALRYPTAQNMVRRIQMRFKTEPDYQRAIEIFKELGLPMRTAGNKESSAAPLRPLRPAPDGVVQNSSGPSSIRAYPALAPKSFNAPSFPEPKPYPPVDSPFFRKPHAINPGIRKADGAWLSDGMRFDRTPSSVSLMQPSFNPKATTTFSCPLSSGFGSQQNIEHHIPPTVMPMRKAESSEYAVSQNSNYNSFPPVSGPVPEPFGPLLSSSRGREIPAAGHVSQYDFGQSKRATSAYGAGIIPRREDNVPLEKLPLLPPEALRPMSAPVHNAHYLSSPTLPPRRELPFPKARDAAKSCTPTNEFSVLLPLEQPNHTSRNNDDVQHVTAAVSAPDPKRTSRMPWKPSVAGAMPLPQDALLDSYTNQHPHDERPGGLAPRVEEPSPLAAKSRALVRPATAPGLRSKVTATVNRKRPSDLPDQMASVSKQIKRVVDRGTQTQTLSGRDHTAPLGLLLINDQPATLPVNGARTPSPPLSFMNHIDTFVSKYKNRAPPQELWVMPGYTEATPEQRQTIINDFICENLDSEEFLQLCEDTADVWRRIGLEM